MDLAGNASEWVFDWYKVDYYRVADDTNPVGPTHRRGEGTGRVVRGGSFLSHQEVARAAGRFGLDPYFCNLTRGFRVGMSANPEFPLK